MAKYLFLFLCLTQAVSAQTQQWVDTVFYPNRTSIVDLNSDQEGRIYSVGGFAPCYHCSTTPGSFIMALEQDQTELWRDTTMNRSNVVSSVYADNAIFVFGNAGSNPLHFGSFILVKPDTCYHSAYVVKYDLNGNVVNAQLYPDVKAIKADISEGQIYFFGYLSNGWLMSNHFSSNFISTFDNNCTMTSCLQVSGTQGVDFDVAGADYLFVGTQTGSSYTQELRRYDSNGNLVWTHSPGLFFYSLSADSLGNCYVSGYNGSGALVNKFDSTGFITASFVPAPLLGAEKVFADGSDLYVFGQIAAGEYTMVKYSADDIEYVCSLGGAEVLCFERVGTNIYLGGWYPYPASQQARLIKISEGSTTSVSSPTTASSLLSVYPNPSSALFTLEYKTDQPEKVSLKVRNAKGQLLMNEMLSPQANEVRKEIDLRSYASGVYTVELVQGKSRIVKKIVLE